MEIKLEGLFIKYRGLMTTKELKSEGISPYMIRKFIKKDLISRISRGNYIHNEFYLHDYEIISLLFPESIIYLESALLLHNYTDRIPNEWKIAVGRNMKMGKYDIDYPKIKAHYVEESILNTGLTEIESYPDEKDKNNKIITKIYDKDKTICDIIKHRNNIDKEVFNTAIKSYINDNDINLNNLYKYARELNILGLIETYIGMWF